jgi:hypothetical protein
MRDTVAAGSSTQRASHPAGLGMMGTDRVDRVRQHTIGRPIQRLTVDLDDARVAVRVRGGRVSVDVVRDPEATLGQAWAHDVERTLESAMRAQDGSSTRMPLDRDRPTTAGTAHHDRPTDDHRDSTADGRRNGRGDGRGDGQPGRDQRNQVPWWLTEEDQ